MGNVFLGIDVGSVSTNLVLIDQDNQVLPLSI
jgi:activator of 2-hydroxyglutaryl-CoA dehydratase